MDYAEKVRRSLFGDAEYERMKEAGDFDSFIVCPPEEKQVREEFARESDIAYQLKMFQAGQAFPRLGAGASGVVDDSVDLLVAHELMADAEDSFKKLPPAVREKYHDYATFMHAVADGSFVAAVAEERRLAEEARLAKAGAGES